MRASGKKRLKNEKFYLFYTTDKKKKVHEKTNLFISKPREN